VLYAKQERNGGMRMIGKEARDSLQTGAEMYHLQNTKTPKHLVFK